MNALPISVVVIPTYDEAGVILQTLDAVLAAMPSVHVLVVDDSSPDGTAQLVEQHPRFGDELHLLRRESKGGLGGAYRAGFAWALSRGYDRIAQMDADLSHPPGRLPALFAALEQADVAIGSRYVRGGGVRDWSLLRRVVSRGGNVFVRVVLRLPVHDTTAGYKAFRRVALEAAGVVESDSEGYCFQIENTWRAVRLGQRVTEVPIIFTDRVVGQSKMTGGIIGEAVVRVVAWRWHELTRPSSSPVGSSNVLV